MYRFLLILLTALALAGCNPGLPADQTAAPPVAADAAAVADDSARLNTWFEQRFEEHLAFRPMRKTYLGRKDGYDQIDDLSEAAHDRWLAWLRNTVTELRASFDYQALSAEDRISWELWVYQLERAEQALPLQRRSYVFTQMSGPQASLPQFLINMHKVDAAEDMEAYIARIGGIARAIEQLLERAQLAAANGVRPPRFAYQGVLEQARAVITGAPFDDAEDSPLWADAQRKIAALREAGKIDQTRADALAAATRAALVGHLEPAYETLIAWFDDDIANSDETAAGVWKLPEGDALYALHLAQHTTTGMTPAEVHEYGLAEVTRLHREITVIKDRIGFDGSLPELFAFMRDDPQFILPDTAAGREGYLQASREHLAFIDQRLPDFFGILPRASLEVKRVERFREQPGAAQHYMSSSPDGSRPGIYYAHLSDMSAMPKHQLEAVAYHEGNPGHHMQIAIAQESTSVPAFRAQGGYTVFSEGWALYAELLAKEMGAYQDPYSDIGRLSTELWRAIRLVVDTGLHSQRWTEEQAVAYFMENSPSAEGAIRSEIRRYIVMPGQATAYKIGMRKILDLRAAAEAELGEAFDIRGFHDTILGGGALPLSLLEQRVFEWVAAQASR